MTIELEVDGNQYTQFTSASASFRLDALTDTFSFSATSEDGDALPFTGGESCKIIVDGETALTGFIEIVEVNYSSNSHDITITGRDKTGDLLDSTLDTISDINAPITLKQLVERIVQELKMDVEVIDEANPEPFNKAEDIAAPVIGKNAFSFLEQYSRKRQVLLTSNGEGNIVIATSSGKFIDSPLKNVKNSNDNNIISGSVSYDTTERFNLYKFSSNLNYSSLAFAGDTSVEKMTDQKGQKEDEQIRKSRQLILISEEAFSDLQNDKRAAWEANIRKARSRVYSVVVDGFRDSTEDRNLWNVNNIVSVVDDFARIDTRMLINTVTFSYDLQTGSTTTLGLINENAYTLTLEDPENEELGDGLFG